MKTTINIEEIKKNREFMFLKLLGSSNKNMDSFIDKQGFRFISSNYKSAIAYKEIKLVMFLKNNTETKLIIFVDGDDKWNENMKKNHPIRYKLGLVTLYKPYIKELGVISNSEDANKIIDVLWHLKYKVEVYTEDCIV